MPDWLTVVVVVAWYAAAGAAVLGFKAFVFVYLPYKFITAVMRYWVGLTQGPQEQSDEKQQRKVIDVKGEWR